MKYLRVILIVLLLVCCTLWVASYWSIWWYSSDGLLAIGLVHGSFIIERHVFDIGVYGLNTFRYEDMETRWWPVVWIYTAPEWWSLKGTYWLPTLLLALLVAISESPWWRRRRRVKMGLCIQCGYDLRGADHDACPECDAEVVKA